MISFKIQANKNEVLVALRENRDRHKKIVTEAKEGFIKEAEKLLSKKLAQAKEGKIRHLSVKLTAPVDYSHEYDTAIRMLELSTESQIEMTTQMVQCYIEDRWEWVNTFTSINSSYSGTARAMLKEPDMDSDL